MNVWGAPFHLFFVEDLVSMRVMDSGDAVSDRGDFHSTLIQVVPVAAAEIDFIRPRAVSGARDY